MKKRALLACVLLGGCSLPERDNDQDPVVRPVAALVVRDLGVPPPEGCSSLAITSSAALVSIAPRGHCLFLDARGTRDPQEAPDAETTALTFEYTLPDHEPPTVLGGKTLLLDSSYRPSLPIGQAITFSVTVTDPGEASSTAQASVILSNAAPELVSQPLRRIPEGGLPWSPGPALVTFSARGSIDPDGDPLTYCWTLPGAAESCDGSATKDVVISAARGATTVFVRVRDNATDLADARSLSTPRRAITVRVGPSLWGVARDFTDRAPRRFDPFPPAPMAVGMFTTFAADLRRSAQVAEDSVVFVTDTMGAATTSTLRAARMSDGAITDSEPIGERVIGFASVPALDTAWTVSRPPAANDGFLLRRWNRGAGGSLSPDGLQAPLAIPLLSTGSDVIVAARPDGRIWLTPTFRDFQNQHHELIVVTPPSTVEILAENVTHDLGTIAPRPGTDEVWTVLRPNFNAGGTGSYLERRSNEGVILDSIFLGYVFPTAFAWLSADEAWLSLSGTGLVRVDINLLLATSSLENAIVEHVSDDLVFGLVSDPEEGSAWGFRFGGDPAVVRLSAFGGLSASVPVPFLRMHFVDFDGSIWYSDGVSLRKTLTFDAEGEVTVLPSYLVNGGDVDLATGWLWTPLVIPNGILAIGETGETIRSTNVVLREGASEPEALPRFDRFVIEQGSEYGWGLVRGQTPSFEPYVSEVLRLDLRDAGVPTSTTWLSGAAADALRLSASLFEPTVPIPGSTPFVWVFSDRQATIGSPRIGALDAPGVFTNLLTVPADEGTVIGARSTRTNRLCVGSVEGFGPTTLHVRWLERAAGVISHRTLLAPDGHFLTNVGNSRVASPVADGCWIVFVEFANCPSPSKSKLWLLPVGASTPSRTIDVDGQIVGFAPQSEDELWLTKNVCDDDGLAAPRRSHLRWNGAGFTETELPGSFRITLVSQEALDFEPGF